MVAFVLWVVGVNMVGRWWGVYVCATALIGVREPLRESLSIALTALAADLDCGNKARETRRDVRVLHI